MLALAIAAGLVLFTINFMSHIPRICSVGNYLEDNLGTFGFLGNFIYQLSDILAHDHTRIGSPRSLAG